MQNEIIIIIEKTSREYFPILKNEMVNGGKKLGSISPLCRSSKRIFQ